jgi:hypothetical protein
MGFLNDQLAGDYGQEAIRWSMLTVGVVGGGSSILFYLAAGNLREDLAAAQQAAAEQAGIQES